MEDQPVKTNLGRHFSKTADGDIVLVNELQVRDFVPPKLKLGPHYQFDKHGNIVSKQEVNAETKNNH